MRTPSDVISDINAAEANLNSLRGELVRVRDAERLAEQLAEKLRLLNDRTRVGNFFKGNSSGAIYQVQANRNLIAVREGNFVPLGKSMPADWVTTANITSIKGKMIFEEEK